MRQVKPPEV